MLATVHLHMTTEALAMRVKENMVKKRSTMATAEVRERTFPITATAEVREKIFLITSPITATVIIQSQDLASGIKIANLSPEISLSRWRR